MKHPVLPKTFRLSLVVAALSANAAFAVSPTLTGRISRGGTPSSFTMTLTLTGVSAADRGTVTEADFARQAIAFKFPKCPSSERRLGYEGESIGTGGTTTSTSTTTSGLGDILDGYQISYTAQPWVATSDNTSYTYTASFTVKQISTPVSGCELNALLVDNPTKSGIKGINISLYYLGPSQTGKTAEKVSDQLYVNQSLSVANEAPANVTAKPTFHSITATYTPKQTIKFKSDTTGDSEDTPTGVVAILVATDQPAFQVHGKTYKSAGNEEFAACSIDPSADACITCPAGAYLDFETIATTEEEASKMKILDVVNGSVIFSGLDPDKSYRVGMVYQPDSLAFSTCSLGQPSVNYSLTELNQDDAKTSLKNPTCFIATAAYGSILDRHIDILRAFRNRYMLTNTMGKSLVRFYYTHSPKIAAEIAKSDTARWATRAVLAPIVGTAFLANEYPLLLAFNVMALCLLGGYLMQRRSRRVHR